MRLTYARAVSLLHVRVVKIGSVPGGVTMVNRCYLSVDNYSLPTVVACAPASGTGRSLSRELVAA
jgi:hypothetical protein